VVKRQLKSTKLEHYGQGVPNTMAHGAAAKKKEVEKFSEGAEAEHTTGCPW